MAAHTFQDLTLEQLTIEDERSFKHVELYADLKDVLVRDKVRFRVLPREFTGRWDHALLLNLTYWETGADVLESHNIPADVVTHVAWHHLAAKALSAGKAGPPSSDALFFGEAIASAFDVYLVGRLLGHAKKSDFLETQVPAMADSADAAGLSEEDFDQLLGEIAEDPDQAFEDLRQLLFDAGTSLVRCVNADDALQVMLKLNEHRFGPLLHRYELSNWVLYSRAFAKDRLEPDAHVRAIDETLREEDVSLEWLASEWIT